MKKNLLFIYAPAGPPIDLALPVMANRADIYTLILVKPNNYNQKIIEKNSVSIKQIEDFSSDEFVDIFVEAGRQCKAEGIVTFSEFIIETVCMAAERLNLKSAGTNISLARNKIKMRTAWRKYDVSQPQFVEVRDENEIHEACAKIGLPLLLKVANSAGSIGQQIIETTEEIPSKIKQIFTTIEQARCSNEHDISDVIGNPRIIAESIIPGTTDSWYEGDELGDYLSVEGLVRDGVYYPLAITARLPTIYPFIEVSNLAPCPLPRIKKQILINVAQKAIDALALENCATHTELKLTANGGVMLIETAARMGGVAIARQLHTVFDINYVDLLICILLGEECDIPKFEAKQPQIAAASMSLIAANSKGMPWESSRYFDPVGIDWHELAGDDIKVSVERAQSMEYGCEMPPFFSSGGVLTNAGIAFVTAPNVYRLATAVKDILNGLEHRLPQNII